MLPLKLESHDDAVLSQVIRDIFPSQVEYLQACFPNATLNIHTDLNICLPVSQRCIVRFSKSISSEEIQKTILSSSQLAPTVLINSVYPMLHKQSLERIIENNSNCLLHLGRHDLKSNDLIAKSTEQIMGLFLANAIPAISIKKSDKSKKWSSKETGNSYECLVPRTFADIILIKTQLAHNFMIAKEAY